MRGSRKIVAVIGLLMLQSCAGTGAQDEAADCRGYAAPPPFFYLSYSSSAVPAAQQDRDFVCQAAIYGTAEVTFARIALQRSGNPAVRGFAAQMISDHVPANDTLAAVAVGQVGVAPPQGLDAGHLMTRNELVTLTGPAFDFAYMGAAVRDHQNAIPYFQQEQAAGSQPNLRHFAEETLPVLQRHLDMAQSIGAQLAAR